MDNKNYNKALQPFASNLRKTMTKAEACLWKYVLKAKKLNGYSFRRQRPIGKYIADFICFELKLIIEVDGYSHTLEDVYNKDIVKSNILKNLGYEVIHFTDAEVLNDISNVIRRLELYINEFEKNPPPTPASGGQHR
jgi:very-short-patch-repair endonuclease